MPRSAERARRQRQSRASLLWGLLLFMTGQLALAMAIERWLPGLRDADYTYRLVRLRKRLRHTPTRPVSVVMLGSSRTMFGLHGQLIEKRLRAGASDSPVVFNFGFPGAGPLRHWLHLRRLLDDGVRPDVVLLEIMPYLLHTDNGTPIDFQQLSADKLRLRELGMLEEEGLRPEELRFRWWLGWPFPAYAHRFAIVSMTVPTLLPCVLRQDHNKGIDASGWTAMSQLLLQGPETRRRAVERARLDHGPALQHLNLCVTTSRVLQETLELCRREGIRTALVIVPEGPLYRSLYSEATWRSVEAHLREIAGRHHVPLINAREWLPEEEFLDSHHMTQEGATRFSERLCQEILPLVRGTAVGGRFHPGGS
jgi:hypothetical protein